MDNGLPNVKQGGGGGELQLETTADVRLAGRALHERWPFKEGVREKILKKLLKHVLSKKSSPRVQIAAAKALMYADKINMEDALDDTPGGLLGGLAVNGDLTIQLVVEKLREDPHYVELSRQMMLNDAAPSPNGNGHQQQGNGHV